MVGWNSNPNFRYKYEVFYQVATGGNNVSVVNTSSTKLTLTRLKLGKTYSIFVVAFGEDRTILPSAHSKIVNISLSK